MRFRSRLTPPSSTVSQGDLRAVIHRTPHSEEVQS